MIKKLLLLVVLLSCCGQVQAKCEKSDIISGKLFTDICWDCVLPIVVAHVNLGASSKSWKPSGATDKYLCVCKNSGGIPTVGVATSFWEPARLIEFEFQPGCLSVLNANLGKSVDGGNPNFDRIQQGTRNTNLQGANKGTTFMHYHYYAFPILQILDMFTGFGCSSDGFLDLDVMYFSELDPTWDDDLLAFFINPEAALVSNPIASVACVPDSFASMVHKPIQTLFWCAGSWGNMYPLAGFINGSANLMRQTSLMTAKVLAALHRRGIAWQTMGDNAMCRGQINPMIIKEQYKFTMIYPRPETQSAHGFGEPPIMWEWNRTIPGQGENPIFLIWRWRDCCNLIDITKAL